MLLSPLDLLVVIFYAGAVLGLGVLASFRQKASSEFFLAGRSLPWPLIGASILATAFSAASLLGGPGEAFEHGMLWLQLQLGDLAAILVVCWLFLPFYQSLNATTAYEYLERRFGPRARLLAALLFQLQVVFRLGVLLYGPALALSALSGIDLRMSIVAVGVVATAYTLMGGLAAVVWTDLLQLVVV
ncbi:MAG TPA: sodium-coupled permease, partial [Candidatus Krumholzibacteria bacterium]|nr:sodium-coupled permease [Candidatus Krumholzibacteria bacterium]